MHKVCISILCALYSSVITFSAPLFIFNIPILCIIFFPLLIVASLASYLQVWCGSNKYQKAAGILKKRRTCFEDGSLIILTDNCSHWFAQFIIKLTRDLIFWLSFILFDWVVELVALVQCCFVYSDSASEFCVITWFSYCVNPFQLREMILMERCLIFSLWDLRCGSKEWCSHPCMLMNLC